VSDTSDTGTTTQASEALECDIVMAGGVTSGIIYPGAVEVISRRYRFRSIGGTSVGAIAAAATAAAGYGRQTGKNLDAFIELGQLAETLGQKASDGRSRLFHLFTGEPSTRPLFAFLTPLFSGGGSLHKAFNLLGAGLSFGQVLVPVAIVGVLGVAICARLTAIDIMFVPILVLMAATASLVTWFVATALLFSRKLLPAWRANGYGVCTGMSCPDVKEHALAFEGLTPWMYGVIQKLAGLPADRPLTFGDLWTAGGEPDDDAERKPRAIELAMIASDLSRKRTVQLPFIESPSPLYVEKSVLTAYFPQAVVNWMVDHAGHMRDDIADPDVIRLPRPRDLPVVFGARLSLSFPILLSALPLKTPDFAKGADKSGKLALRRVWISDGWLTSNFPIHFFDSPIPSRPTFCLNLVSFESEVTVEGAEGATASAASDHSGGAMAEPRNPERTASRRVDVREKRQQDPNVDDPVWRFIAMPRGARGALAIFTPFDKAGGAGVGAFLSAALNTARFWSDNQLLLAPGVRDRVVNIGLRDDEGGLNLDMAADVIAELDWRGRAAGLLISSRFDPDCEIDPQTGEVNDKGFADHRWTRYRSFMAAFEDTSRHFARSRRASDQAAQARGEPSLDELIDSGDHSYPILVGARSFFRQVTDDYEELALDMADRTRTHEEETFNRVRAPGAKPPAGAAPRQLMKARLRPLPDSDPRAEFADLPERPMD
jgi:hypothetical protein